MCSKRVQILLATEEFIKDRTSPGNLGSIPGHIVPKTLKMVLDTSLFNTQWYKVHIKRKVEQSRERSNTLPYTFKVAIEKGAFRSPSTKGRQLY